MSARECMVNVVVGEPQLSLWCEQCLTSAGVYVPIYAMTTSGLTEIGSVKFCATCDDVVSGD
jgi:hypothetical protein